MNDGLELGNWLLRIRWGILLAVLIVCGAVTSLGREPSRAPSGGGVGQELKDLEKQVLTPAVPIPKRQKAKVKPAKEDCHVVFKTGIFCS